MKQLDVLFLHRFGVPEKHHVYPNQPSTVDGPAKSFTSRWMVYPWTPMITVIIKIIITSSTAQGGGRSFKKRKPIGEIGCCESRMAEPSR